MNTTLRNSLCAGIITASALFGTSSASAAPPPATAEPPLITVAQKMSDGETVEVYYRKGLPITADRVRAGDFKTETLLLKAGTVRRAGAAPLTCDILFEKDVPVELRDGTVIYVDIFRPVDDAQHPAIMAWSPYGKEIGGQWLDDVPNRSGVPLNATSDLQKFEAADPAYWVAHGYVILNPDSRGAYNSEGNLNYWGSQNAQDGYDTIEWAARQPWSNGKIGMSGNSWLTVSQWFIAGEQPPHLAAIAPWEGFVDHFRETANRGGIPNPVFPEVIFETFTSKNYIEDQPRMVVTHTVMDSYWRDKIAKLHNINIPAYVVASYTNPVHTHGTFAGFREIPSKNKWLRVHNTNEWFDYYLTENVEDLRKFFDFYLNDVPNDWEQTPRVRLSILDPGHEDIINRVEKEFPLARTEYKKLFLTDGNKLSFKPQRKSTTLAYDAESEEPLEKFTLTFDRDTELTGYMNLHLFVEADGSDDMELHVTVEKLDANGNQIPDRMTGLPIQAEGYLRVSQRALDEEKSTPSEPVLLNEREELLSAGEVAEINVGIWPMGMLYHKGEQLLLTVSAYRPPRVESIPPFGAAKISIPKVGYTYDPNAPVELKTVGGNATEVTFPELAVKAPPSRNKGRHIIHVGGKYDSFLLVPVVK